MCGIVGYVGRRDAVGILMRGLSRLEYRGYDSAGIAVLKDMRSGLIEIRKSQGKLEKIEPLIADLREPGQSAGSTLQAGIGHTRWATHGKPTTQNAHPHRTGHVVLVHNGIIENYQEIRKSLLMLGHEPQSETDSELLGFLILDEMEKGSTLLDAVRKSFTRVEGACSVVVMSEREPGVIVGVRNGSPLAAAVDPEGGAILASDSQPLIEVSRDIFFLEQGDVVVGDAQGVRFFDLKTGAKLERGSILTEWSVETLGKQGFAHYMLKEIFEQPAALVDTMNGLIERSEGEPFWLADPQASAMIEKASDLVFVACGTSWHAALLGKYWFERFAQVPVSVELASEFRYRRPVLSKNTLVIAMSQSGETADTLAVVRQARALGSPVLGLCNVRGSTLAREADAMLYTSAGPEIGVAATKTFSTQMLSVLILAGCLGRKKNPGGFNREMRVLFDDLLKLPHLMTTALDALPAAAREAAAQVSSRKGFFFIGRGYSFPIALEAALKLKEIAYVHAEGYAGGELKHGPIAMIDQNMVVIVLAPRDSWREKTLSNLEEVKARGAVILGVGDEEDAALKGACDHFIDLPSGSQRLHEALMPFLLTPVIQLLSYELALIRGTDVDKPRNLAKSVTVE